MKLMRLTTVIGSLAICMAFALLESPVLASGTKTTTSTTTTKPADLVDSKDLAGQLLPEGKKIEIIGALSKEENGRFVLNSEETKKAYKVLENSILGSMADTIEKKSDQVFKAVARVTVFKKENFIFITKVELM